MSKAGFVISIADFRQLYERHIGDVVSGNLKAVLADMATDKMPAMMDGIAAPRGDVDGFEIKDVYFEGDRGIGETIYQTRSGAIGLRSIWEQRDDGWKAVALENFAVA